MNVISSVEDEGAMQPTLQLYPNPTNGTVSIKNLEEEASVHVYSMTGELVRTYKNIKHQIQITDLPIGTYVVEIKNRQINERHKIVKVE